MQPWKEGRRVRRIWIERCNSLLVPAAASCLHRTFVRLNHANKNLYELLSARPSDRVLPLCGDAACVGEIFCCRSSSPAVSESSFSRPGPSAYSFYEITCLRFRVRASNIISLLARSARFVHGLTELGCLSSFNSPMLF